MYAHTIGMRNCCCRLLGLFSKALREAQFKLAAALPAPDVSANHSFIRAA